MKRIKPVPEKCARFSDQDRLRLERDRASGLDSKAIAPSRNAYFGSDSGSRIGTPGRFLAVRMT